MNDARESGPCIGTRKQGQEGTGPAQGLGQAGEDRVQVDVEQLVKEVLRLTYLHFYQKHPSSCLALF